MATTRSRFSGGGQEFLDHRNFHHGDDLRAVNWRAYLRLDKLFLKMFQIEPRVPVHLLLDTSASMASGEGTKFDVARKIAASLCYIGLVRLDTIAVQPFSGISGEGIIGGGGRHRFRPDHGLSAAHRGQERHQFQSRDSRVYSVHTSSADW